MIGYLSRQGNMELSSLLGTTHLVPQEKFPRKPHNKSFIAGSFFTSLWTWSTPSRSINRKKNLAIIQPSWPHTWSITHTSRKLEMNNNVFESFAGSLEYCMGYFNSLLGEMVHLDKFQCFLKVAWNSIWTNLRHEISHCLVLRRTCTHDKACFSSFLS